MNHKNEIVVSMSEMSLKNRTSLSSFVFSFSITEKLMIPFKSNGGILWFFMISFRRKLISSTLLISRLMSLLFYKLWLAINREIIYKRKYEFFIEDDFMFLGRQVMEAIYIV